MGPALVDALQRGQWGPGPPSAGVCDDAAGQDTFDDAAADVAEDLRRHAKLPQPPQRVQPLLGPLDQLRGVQCPDEVLTNVNAQGHEAAQVLHFQLLHVQWPMRSSFPC